jgi:cytochrome P450
MLTKSDKKVFRKRAQMRAMLDHCLSEAKWISDLCDALGLPDGKPLSDEEIADVLLNAMEQK